MSYEKNYWGTRAVLDGIQTLHDHLVQSQEQTAKIVAFMKLRVAAEELYASKLEAIAKGEPKFDASTTQDATYGILCDIYKDANSNATARLMLARSMRQSVLDPMEHYVLQLGAKPWYVSERQAINELFKQLEKQRQDANALVVRSFNASIGWLQSRIAGTATNYSAPQKLEQLLSTVPLEAYAEKISFLSKFLAAILHNVRKTRKFQGSEVTRLLTDKLGGENNPFHGQEAKATLFLQKWLTEGYISPSRSDASSDGLRFSSMLFYKFTQRLDESLCVRPDAAAIRALREAETMRQVMEARMLAYMSRAQEADMERMIQVKTALLTLQRLEADLLPTIMGTIDEREHAISEFNPDTAMDSFLKSSSTGFAKLSSVVTERLVVVPLPFSKSLQLRSLKVQSTSASALQLPLFRGSFGASATSVVSNASRESVTSASLIDNSMISVVDWHYQLFGVPLTAYSRGVRPIGTHPIVSGVINFASEYFSDSRANAKSKAAQLIQYYQTPLSSNAAELYALKAKVTRMFRQRKTIQFRLLKLQNPSLAAQLLKLWLWDLPLSLVVPEVYGDLELFYQTSLPEKDRENGVSSPGRSPVLRSLLKDEPDVALARCNSVGRLLLTMPKIHYHNLKKLALHLSSVLKEGKLGRSHQCDFAESLAPFLVRSCALNSQASTQLVYDLIFNAETVFGVTPNGILRESSKSDNRVEDGDDAESPGSWVDDRDLFELSDTDSDGDWISDGSANAFLNSANSEGATEADKFSESDSDACSDNEQVDLQPATPGTNPVNNAGSAIGNFFRRVSMPALFSSPATSPTSGGAANRPGVSEKSVDGTAKSPVILMSPLEHLEEGRETDSTLTPMTVGQAITSSGVALDPVDKPIEVKISVGEGKVTLSKNDAKLTVGGAFDKPRDLSELESKGTEPRKNAEEATSAKANIRANLSASKPRVKSKNDKSQRELDDGGKSQASEQKVNPGSGTLPKNQGKVFSSAAKTGDSEELQSAKDDFETDENENSVDSD